MKKLPIGIQTFADIRTDTYCYVDKTPLIARLVEQGRFYFLSRPRRFGKSLLLDTLAQAFSGNKELFQGLYLENNWDWKVTHPVITIDFAQGILTSRQQLNTIIEDIIQQHATAAEIVLAPHDEVQLLFAQLIRELHQKTGQQVVVLVDEYDKPILDNITDRDKAAELREGLRNIYSVLKAQGAHLHFVMLTGVSKFSKVSLFSGLNNLEDITLDSRFGSLCGYTQKELETGFAEYLEGVDLRQVKKWYNGYNFLGEPVYNPFDILLYFRNREFRPYWFETGTPSFLIRMLMERKLFIPELENLTADEELLSSFDVDYIAAESLLFQTGYLTITGKEQLFDEEYVYHLGFPNHEVRKSLTGSILHWYTHELSPLKNNQVSLFKALRDNNFAGMEKIFHAFFASIPHDWYRKNELAGYEGYYCSVVYCYFAALGLDVQPEDVTNHGRIDLTVRFEKRVYIVEFKVNELTKPGCALEQIKRKKYAEKYQGQGKEIWLIGVEFSRTERNISRFGWEKA
ncbi:PD-(D/E)XK nuclease superfamily protein [Candidatus Electrothrix marina]|uniref:PD-(D/E)XK nuclease superfamily protein n=1 Tax=Candidatus Electrothrix marina TaxID=1859130 RepID=A0A444JG60_9BACT|nr:PD-(D/E)XK nuclease superfamily protein [Candidatus Electrothrix marina]